MKIINFFGGPGSGKSTMAAEVFACFKNHGASCELVGEVAKTLIYEGREHLLGSDGNQLLVSAMQYDRLKGLERAGCTLAISDSPLVMQLAYASDPEFNALRTYITGLDKAWPQINVWVQRTKNYDPYGRMQKTIEDARLFDVKIALLLAELGVPVGYNVTGDTKGQEHICELLLSDPLLAGVTK